MELREHDEVYLISDPSRVGTITAVAHNVMRCGVLWEDGDWSSYRIDEVALDCPDPEVLAERAERARLAELERLEKLRVAREKSEALVGNIKRVLDEWYGEDYDIQISDVVDVIVHYPVVNLVSESRAKHTITDLYVKFTFRDGKMRSELQGWRGSYSQAEANSDYAHSHLSGLTYDWRGFCLGSGEIKGVMLDLSQEYDEDSFYLFLNCLDNYVKWESTSGTPYKYVRNITSRGASLGRLDRHYLESGWIKFKIFIKANPTSLKLTFNKVLGRFEYLITEDYLNLVDRLDVRKALRTEDRSKYLSSQSNSYDASRLNGSKIIYKGQAISPIINREEEEERLVSCAHPDYYPYIIEQLNYSINESFSKQASAASYSKIERIISCQQA